MTEIKPWNILKESDAEIFNLLDAEFMRQRDGIELIASENFASMSVISAAANVLTNKYAEGLPHKRYYGGCEVVDQVEEIAIKRVCQLFDCKFANVQPHSGAQANQAVFLALIKPQDIILGLDLSHGGHLTHGSKVNFSGINYQSHFYGVNKETERLDYDEIARLTLELKPKMIIAGASAYAREIDFARFRAIADSVGAYLLVDMAHIAGLVAAGEHLSPIPHAHVVTSTTHKTLRGPRGGIILWNDETLTAKLNKAVFPGIQGGPLEHIIAAKAVAFKEALAPEFKLYQKKIKQNASRLAEVLRERGFKLVTDGTDNHLLLIDLSNDKMSGKEFEEALGKVNITVNKNTVPREKRSPFVTSGIRIGTPAVTSRGMTEEDMVTIGQFIFEAKEAALDNVKISELKEAVVKFSRRFSLYNSWQ